MYRHTNSLETQRDKASQEDSPLQTPVDLELGAEQPYLDNEYARLAEANRATNELYQLAKLSSRTCRDPLAVQKCVTNGADVNFKLSYWGLSILMMFCDAEDVEAVRICLSSALPIDFTIADSTGATILVRLWKIPLGSIDERVELIRAAVQHMVDHPEDEVDWSETEFDRVPLDFISLIAENQLLSAVWPVIRDVPYFADRRAPIRLTGKLWRWDFNALGAEQPYFDTASVSWVEANRVTGELYQLAEVRSRTCRDPLVVQKCVTNGADVNFQISDMDESILMMFCGANDVDAVRICLSTALPINFSDSNFKVEPILLHLLSTRFGSVDERVELLRAAVQHMAEHPEDTVDWSQTKQYSALDFISLAAQNQLLSAVWPVIRDVPYFANRRAPIRLTGDVWRWDFNALVAEQPYFDTSSARWVEANRATGELYLLSEGHYDICRDPLAVQKCVTNGADVTFKISDMDESILMMFCDANDVEAVRICLSTALPIDFTITDRAGEALLLHLLSTRLGSVSERVELIRAAVQHMAEHPEDTVDWSQTEMYTQKDFISLAAEYHMLSAVWPVIRDVPYFADHVDPIPLIGKVWRWDFNALGADQPYFDTSSASW